MWNPFKRKNHNNIAAERNAAAMTGYFPLPKFERPEGKYTQWVEEVWEKNPTATACIRLKAKAIGRLPLRVYSEQGGEEIDIPNHPVWSLLKRPNKKQSWLRFHKQFWQHCYLDGNVYILKLGTINTVREIRLLRPDRMEIQFDSRGEISAYRYTVEGEFKDYLPEEILHITAENSLKDNYGSAPLKAAAWAIDSENMGGQWNVNLLANRCEPSMVLEGDASAIPPSPDDVKMTIEKLQDRHGGYSNVGKPIWFGGGFKAKTIAFNPKDMDWQNGMVGAQIRICIVCEVPPELAGVQGQKTFSNFQEAHRFFYMNSVIPDGEDFLEELTMFLQGIGGSDPFVIGIDYNKVDALQEDRTATWTRATAAREKGGLSTDEYRKEIGFGPLKDKQLGEAIIVPGNLMTLEDIVGGGIPDEVNPKPQPPQFKVVQDDEGTKPQPGMEEVVA